MVTRVARVPCDERLPRVAAVAQRRVVVELLGVRETGEPLGVRQLEPVALAAELLLVARRAVERVRCIATSECSWGSQASVKCVVGSGFISGG